MSKAWTPPFCAHATTLPCPACKKKNSVRVREQETYFDGVEVEAYCWQCHAVLEVQAQVTVEFSDAELAYGADP
jgi:hypothetical protein